MAILSAGPIPLYHQLEQDISARILAGEFGPGGPLPTEDQIGQDYGVSRITVRKALDSLDRQGLIVRRRGIGSFVAEHSTRVHATHLSGSLDDFLQTANQLKPTILALGPVEASDEIARLFEVEPGSPVLRLELVSSSAEGPLAHSSFHFPEHVIDLLRAEDINSTEPIVRTVERKTNVKVVRAEQVIEADTAGAETARLLGLAEGTPLLRSQRTYFTSEGKPIEVATLRYHPGRYRYEVELKARPYAI